MNHRKDRNIQILSSFHVNRDLYNGSSLSPCRIVQLKLCKRKLGANLHASLTGLRFNKEYFLVNLYYFVFFLGPDMIVLLFGVKKK